MKIKTHLNLYIGLLMITLLSTQVSAESLLWKISGKDIQQPSYLYGTMHVICHDKGVSKNKVQKAIAASAQLYTEIDEKSINDFDAMMDIISTDIKIKQLKDIQKKDELLNLAAKHLGLSTTILEDTSLFMLFSMIAVKTMSQCDTMVAVEDQLMKIFSQAGKPMLGLETLSQQLNALKASQSFELDAVLFSLRHFEEALPYAKTLNELYEQERLNELYEKMITPTPFLLQSHIDSMVTFLLNNRNRNWVKVIPELARKTPTFFAVGVGHLPGEQGVIQLLKNKGYEVEPVLDVALLDS